MNRIWEFAGINVSAEFQYPYLAKQCCLYESEKPSVLSVTVTSADIEHEHSLNKDGLSYSDGYLESLAFYRKFSVAALDYGVLLMHGSAIGYKDRGYIFTAPSGTGKSTHARLCKEFYGDDVSYINDDKPLLRFIDGTWYVYGTPWNGKHRLSENISVPLACICLLERGDVNTIRKTTFDESLSALMSQIYRPDDSVSMQKVLNLIMTIGKIPFWKLRCNISEEAARLSLGTMGDTI